MKQHEYKDPLQTHLRQIERLVKVTQYYNLRDRVERDQHGKRQKSALIPFFQDERQYRSVQVPNSQVDFPDL